MGRTSVDNAAMRTRLLAFCLAFVLPVAAGAQPVQQAVIDTTAGTIVWDLLADKAPNHVALFIKTAQDGGYDGTTFHRMVRYGIVQGGDPVTKDPAARDKYGSGGLNLLKTEITDEKQTSGAVAAVQVPGKPDSAGTQFFMCINAQPSLDGKYTVFARVVEGHAGRAEDFGDAGGRQGPRHRTRGHHQGHDSRQAGGDAGAVLDRIGRGARAVSGGARNLDRRASPWRSRPDKAPDARAQLPAAGAGGRLRRHELPPRREGIRRCSRATCRRARSRCPRRQQSFIRPIKAEFNDQVHDLGTLSMARTDDPDSATSSFFIVTARATALDGKYTAFGRVVSGIEVAQKIEAVAVNGETPVDRVELIRVTVQKP